MAVNHFALPGQVSPHSKADSVSQRLLYCTYTPSQAAYRARDIRVNHRGSDDQSEDQNSGSYWSSAFITTTTGKQFLLIHHQYAVFCKSSVLDLDSLKYWKHWDHCGPNNDTKTLTSDSLSVRFPDFSVVATTPDKISGLELFAKSPDYSFTLDVECRTSKVLLNGGNGVIAWGPDRANSNTTHWFIPAARTSGSLTLGTSKPLAVDPSRSFTYYDHQNIYDGAQYNFTWFEAHSPDSRIRVSIWAYDWSDSSEEWRYATVRVGEETMMVLPYTWQVDWNDTWCRVHRIARSLKDGH
ncbi:hypothetical protein B0O99DRAFT_695889 [Bisporella sp. PMI_857]|nr:hypothetical protein B0O99DRAFT_695889 [Bisporella sp. PMI_857]